MPKHFWMKQKTLLQLMPVSNNFFFNCNILAITVNPISPKLSPKCPFSSLLSIVSGVFPEISLKTMQSLTMGHSLTFPTKKNVFGGAGLPGGPETAQISPKLLAF